MLTIPFRLGQINIGWEGILSNLYIYGDIFASRKLRIIKLPTSVDELTTFLENNKLNVVKTIMVGQIDHTGKKKLCEHKSAIDALTLYVPCTFRIASTKCQSS